MKKDEIENGIKIFTDALKNTKTKLNFKTDVCYLRKLDGRFLDSSNQERFILGYVLLTEDPEKIQLLDMMVQKGIEKRNIKFEDLGEINIQEEK